MMDCAGKIEYISGQFSGIAKQYLDDRCSRTNWAGDRDYRFPDNSKVVVSTIPIPEYFSPGIPAAHLEGYSFFKCLRTNGSRIDAYLSTIVYNLLRFPGEDERACVQHARRSYRVAEFSWPEPSVLARLDGWTPEGTYLMALRPDVALKMASLPDWTFGEALTYETPTAERLKESASKVTSRAWPPYFTKMGKDFKVEKLKPHFFGERLMSISFSGILFPEKPGPFGYDRRLSSYLPENGPVKSGPFAEVDSGAIRKLLKTYGSPIPRDGAEIIMVPRIEGVAPESSPWSRHNIQSLPFCTPINVFRSNRLDVLLYPKSDFIYQNTAQFFIRNDHLAYALPEEVGSILSTLLRNRDVALTARALRSEIEAWFAIAVSFPWIARSAWLRFVFELIYLAFYNERESVANELISRFHRVLVALGVDYDVATDVLRLPLKVLEIKKTTVGNDYTSPYAYLGDAFRRLAEHLGLVLDMQPEGSK